MEHWIGQSLRHHLNGPLVHAHKEDARVKAVVVFSREEVYVCEVVGREKGLDGESGFDDD